MRIRATVAAVSGALAFSALTVPAYAQDTPAPDRSGVPEFDLPAPPQGRSLAARAASDTQVTKVTVNSGKAIVVGTTNVKTVTVSVTATDSSGVFDASAMLWHGTDPDDPDSYGILPNEDYGDCVESSATTATCKVTFTIDPAWLFNEDAGTWNVAAAAVGWDGSEAVDMKKGTTKFQRFSRLSVNAAPEPVKKGKTITITGALTRANWDTNQYAGYTKQAVKLQFRKKGSDTYTTVKTVTSDSKGNLKTTRTAATDGYWRWNFAGTSTTPAVKASGDFVDVK